MKIILSFLLITIFAVQLYSQSDKQIIGIQGSQVLLKGKITDEVSGKPIGTGIEFISKDGRKIKTQSNSITGEWEQLLTSGEYEVILFSWNVARKTTSIAIEEVEKFKEIRQDFTVKRMMPNDIMFNLNAFADNSATPNRSILNELEVLKVAMRFNRGVQFIVYINSTDNNLTAKRIEEINNYFKDWGSQARRIRVEEDKSQRFTTQQKNLSVLVEKNEDVFNR